MLTEIEALQAQIVSAQEAHSTLVQYVESLEQRVRFLEQDRLLREEKGKQIVSIALGHSTSCTCDYCRKYNSGLWS